MQNNQSDTEFIFDQLDKESLERKKEKSNPVTYSSSTVYYSRTENNDVKHDTEGDSVPDLTDATSDGADVASEASSGIADSLMDGADVASEASSGIGEMILEGLLAIVLFPFKLIGALIGSLFDS